MTKAVASLLRRLDRRDPYGVFSLDSGTWASKVLRTLEGR